jgi:hypothetical protein
MKKTITLSALLTLILISFFNDKALSQDRLKDTTRYLFKPEWKEKLKQTPGNSKRWNDFELHARMYAKYAVPEEKTLPIVFNLIHIDNAVKVTVKDITNQIQVLNDAFAGKMRGETKKQFEQAVSGDSKIKFCIGSPQGKKDGIYTASVAQAYDFQTLGNISDKKNGLEGAKKDEYINVWVTELPEELGGFAILPGHDESRDGIYIDPDFFGVRQDQKQYHSGKTLIHLMGQYLGLLPLWTNGDCMDDNVEDTPVHNAPNAACYMGGHISLCPGNPMEMVGNFMDSNPDDCAWFFTKGQVARMHAALGDLGYRKNLMQGIKVCDNKSINEVTIESRNITKDLDFTLIPNPAQTRVEILFENPDKGESIEVQVLSLNQQRMAYQTIPALGEHRGKVVIEIKDWPTGQYYVTLKTNKSLKTKTLMTIK